jgi:hypothetical protein
MTKKKNKSVALFRKNAMEPEVEAARREAERAGFEAVAHKLAEKRSRHHSVTWLLAFEGQEQVALRAARDGNPDFLAALLRVRPRRWSSETQHFLAQVLTQEIPLPTQRKRDAEARRDKRLMRIFDALFSGLPKGRAQEEAAAKSGADLRTIQRDSQKLSNMTIEIKQYRDMAEIMRTRPYSKAARYEIDPTGLTVYDMN